MRHPLREQRPSSHSSPLFLSIISSRFGSRILKKNKKGGLKQNLKIKTRNKPESTRPAEIKEPKLESSISSENSASSSDSESESTRKDGHETRSSPVDLTGRRKHKRRNKKDRKRSSSSSSTSSSSSSSDHENIIVQKLKKSIKNLKLNKKKSRKESTSSSATSSEYSYSSLPTENMGNIKETRKKALLAPKRRKRWDSYTSTATVVDGKKKRSTREDKVYYDLPQTFLDNIE